jgi:hypothetical protein
MVGLMGCAVEPLDEDEDVGSVALPNNGMCSTCTQRGLCVEPSAKACGSGGEACQACLVGVCEVGYCLDGECAVFVAPDNTPCGRDSVNICTSGVCAPP